MTLYAAAPARRARQLLGDLLFLAWTGAWTWAGLRAHDAVLELAAPGRATMNAAGDIAGQLRDVEDRIAGVPLVGDDLTGPFGGMASQADGLAAAGASLVETVGQLALAVGLAVALVPVLLVAVVHVPLRVRFVRRASAARRAVRQLSAGDGARAAALSELFALRALANQPVRKLAAITGDPVAAWRDGDEAAIRRLADLELRDLGVRR
ncbi:hypothetical protein [Myceligenerans pegani]|uniref:Transmembrane protein n=1 Tax=Myceligenerans pegani TaxID=2776917 RepID=A0ABR9N5N1_9MICO|nr:hypothetical protein [Myceligenerans sp. TRM 65318]MBE1878953.1 hypothetical protein [Myceligenerans sp. TRM 65318]MBE3021224.1 hypothetical protein [Myceligenerans sp. TRM 65318]